MKILLDYDITTKQVSTPDGGLLLVWHDLEKYELKEGHSSIEELVKLKNAGFTVDEIIELRRKELI